MTQIVTRVPFKEGHTDHHVFIESFPEQKHVPEGPGILPQKQQTLDYLRAELISLVHNRPEIEASICYRTCFKWQQREFIEYCLQKKCGDPGFKTAASKLGLLR
jgi:hypothetical protein